MSNRTSSPRQAKRSRAVTCRSFLIIAQRGLVTEHRGRTPRNGLPEPGTEEHITFDDSVNRPMLPAAIPDADDILP